MAESVRRPVKCVIRNLGIILAHPYQAASDKIKIHLVWIWIRRYELIKSSRDRRMGVWCWCWRAAEFCVVCPFPGGRHSHAARRAGRDRGAHASGARASGARASGARASGAGDAVNGKCEKKTVTVDAPRYQVVLLETNLGSADMYETLNQDSRFKKKLE